MRHLSICFLFLLCSINAFCQVDNNYEYGMKADYLFILTHSPKLTMKYPKDAIVPSSGKWYSLSYDSSRKIAFIYNESACGYYKVPNELTPGFERVCENLQEDNHELYWQRVNEIMECIDKKQKLITSTPVPELTPGLLRCINGPVTKKTENDIFDGVEQMPSFVGGSSALAKYMKENVEYPEGATEDGRVICTFVVEKDGSISNVRLAKSINTALDREAIRVIATMPKWIPGKQNGKILRVKYTLPIILRKNSK